MRRATTAPPPEPQHPNGTKPQPSNEGPAEGKIQTRPEGRYESRAGRSRGDNGKGGDQRGAEDSRERRLAFLLSFRARQSAARVEVCNRSFSSALRQMAAHRSELRASLGTTSRGMPTNLRSPRTAENQEEGEQEPAREASGSKPKRRRGQRSGDMRMR